MNNNKFIVSKKLEELKKVLPLLFTRRDIQKNLGSIISRGTLANLGKKNGPPYEIIGNKAVYEKDSFLEWLEKHFNLTSKGE